jgi:hypothetical protein
MKAFASSSSSARIQKLLRFQNATATSTISSFSTTEKKLFMHRSAVTAARLGDSVLTPVGQMRSIGSSAPHKGYVAFILNEWKLEVRNSFF